MVKALRDRAATDVPMYVKGTVLRRVCLPYAANDLSCMPSLHIALWLKADIMPQYQSPTEYRSSWPSTNCGMALRVH